jgi:flagellar biosynthesis/type III secretory pathway M-ring protein FliF/YscJ
METGGAAANADGRDHSIRIVLFERSPLSAGDENVIRRAIAAEIGLSAAAGDEVSFSPAPLVAAPVPADTIAAVPKVQTETRQEAQERFMASVARGWTIALSLLGLAVLAFGVVSIRRRQLGRRADLVQRIRQHLLLSDGIADAP